MRTHGVSQTRRIACYYFFMQLIPDRNRLTSLSFWWLSLTILYVGLGLLFNVPTSDSHGAGIIGYVIGFIGLFVPYGMASITYPLSWISIPFVIFAIISVERELRKSTLSPLTKILVNLIVLLVLTAVADGFRAMPFESWSIFLNAGSLHLGSAW